MRKFLFFSEKSSRKFFNIFSSQKLTTAKKKKSKLTTWHDSSKFENNNMIKSNNNKNRERFKSNNVMKTNIDDNCRKKQCDQNRIIVKKKIEICSSNFNFFKISLMILLIVIHFCWNKIKICFFTILFIDHKCDVIFWIFCFSSISRINFVDVLTNNQFFYFLNVNKFLSIKIDFLLIEIDCVWKFEIDKFDCIWKFEIDWLFEFEIEINWFDREISKKFKIFVFDKVIKIKWFDCTRNFVFKT